MPEKGKNESFIRYLCWHWVFAWKNRYMSSKSRKVINNLNRHTECTYSLFIRWSFDSNINKYDYYRDEDCMKNFCKNSKEHVMKRASFERLKMLPLKARKTNFIKSISFVIYAEINLIIMTKIIGLFKITVIILRNIRVLYILTKF